MNLTPQSVNPSKSSYQFPPHSQPLYHYPSPTQNTFRYKSADSLQGLGVYSCTMPGSTREIVGSETHNQSSAPATNRVWPTQDAEHGQGPGTAISIPNMLSAEYDPFASFHPSDVPFSDDIYSAQSAETGAFSVSPVPSGSTSQRSSFSSAPTSEIFTQAGSIHSYTPRIKMEELTDYSIGSESMMLSSPQLSHGLLVTTASPYSGSLEASYYQEPAPMSWSKVEYSSNQDLPSISSLSIPQYDRRSESLDRVSVGSHDQRLPPSNIARTRQPRKLTTKEDANFQCQVKGCNKLFGRSYNFKAHMETHDATREYPFPCTVNDCDKKFVRKTDLQRHHQSVHMKQRNHRCDYCSRYFARKDTLRRHMEDGCSKRFDIETVDFRPQGYSNNGGNDPGSMRLPSRPVEAENRHSSYTSSSNYHYSPSPGHPTSHGQHESSLTSASTSYLDRHEYMTGDGNPDPVWPR